MKRPREESPSGAGSYFEDLSTSLDRSLIEVLEKIFSDRKNSSAREELEELLTSSQVNREETVRFLLDSVSGQSSSSSSAASANPNPEIQKKSLWAIEVICRCKAGQNLFAIDGAKIVLMNSVERNPSDQEAREIVFRTMRNIACSPEGRELLQDENVKSVLLSSIENEGEGRKNRAAALLAISNIAYAPSERNIFLVEEVKSVLLRAVEDRDELISLTALEALGSIVVSSAGQNFFADEAEKSIKTALATCLNKTEPKKRELAIRFVEKVLSTEGELNILFQGLVNSSRQISSDLDERMRSVERIGGLDQEIPADLDLEQLFCDEAKTHSQEVEKDSKYSLGPIEENPDFFYFPSTLPDGPESSDSRSNEGRKGLFQEERPSGSVSLRDSVSAAGKNENSETCEPKKSRT
ncbi:MAG: hypothetical protein KGP29_05095 [Proteobacteria bacterium]|nr:hypothetical protein [Pseudomonadota bacterium]